jgi:hypothetical protein
VRLIALKIVAQLSAYAGIDQSESKTPRRKKIYFFIAESIKKGARQKPAPLSTGKG